MDAAIYTTACRLRMASSLGVQAGRIYLAKLLGSTQQREGQVLMSLKALVLKGFGPTQSLQSAPGLAG